MDIKELGPIGAELNDIDLTKLNDDESCLIKKYFLDFSVLVFRNQRLEPEDLKNISKLWGLASIHPVFQGIEGRLI